MDDLSRNRILSADPGAVPASGRGGPARRIAVSGIGVGVGLLGLVVMAGWALHLDRVVQLQPGLVPMQFNTALAFALLGAGLVLASRGRARGALLAGLPVAALGAATLAEHLGGLDLGLDQLFFTHYITVASSAPGRMAPNTALCFLLGGSVLALDGAGRRWPAASGLSGLFGALVVGLGMAALTGYLMGIPTAYGWGNLTRMAPHTALAFALLGGGLLGHAWQAHPPGRDWRPAAVMLLTATITVALWQALEAIGNDGNDSVGVAGKLFLVFGLAVAISLASAFASAVRAHEAADRAERSRQALAEEIAERNKAETQLRMAYSVVANTSEGVLVTDLDGWIVSVNPAFTQITGYTAEEVVGRRASILKSDHHGEQFYRDLWAALNATGHWSGEIWNRRKSGEIFPEWQTINRIPARDGQPACYVSVFRDISEQREADEKLRHLAFHDALTGLPNRALFHDRLGQALERARRDGTALSLSFVDLDGFKAVNDALGHDIGDGLLQEVARRIRSHMRRGVDTVARLGGDEFVILMEEIPDNEHSLRLMDRLIAEIALPMQLRDSVVQVGASMGIVFFPCEDCDAPALMRRADAAMYAAKVSGKGCCLPFDRETLVPLSRS